ncbi:hypothetical protein [Amnibacterium kyonggiense]|uniref:Uncharacterized protein n=1 Tax=Amnibacterium kyonggiense TaxID=595671 RepID=A0A4R7FQ22_9MICO|nr:hypothetical protein [Amnibacterium kyonggiense]TDS79758.1 hypothetical protein CLV52_0300 [Amnibacterium kyonggiense]
MTRPGSAVLAAALLVVVVVLGVAAVLRDPLELPVVAHLGAASVRIAAVQGAAAVLVPPLLVAVAAGLHATGRLDRSAAVWASGAAAPIVLFLVARLNGVLDAMALVLVYASSAGGVLLRSLHRPDGRPAALRWWSVLGVVPWGVVAFTQIGAGLAGTGPGPAVRVLTLVVLAASIAEFVLAYRRRDRPGVATSDLVAAAAPGVLLAALVVALVR